MSARLMTGMPRRCASRISGLSLVAAEVMTTRPASSTLAASWPSWTVAPWATSRSVNEESRRSEPLTGVAPGHEDAGDGGHVDAADAHQVDPLRYCPCGPAFSCVIVDIRYFAISISRPRCGRRRRAAPGIASTATSPSAARHRSGASLHKGHRFGEVALRQDHRRAVVGEVAGVRRLIGEGAGYQYGRKASSGSSPRVLKRRRA